VNSPKTQIPSAPIQKIFSQLHHVLKTQREVWIQSPTGSGKSTFLPLELLKANIKKIYVVVPRRIAALSAAKYCAYLSNTKLGDKVGYIVRGDHRPGQNLIFCTDGSFLRILQKDPSLADTSHVLLDEIHERRWQQDLIYHLILQSQDFFNEKLLLLNLSATLDGFSVPDTVPVLQSEGQMFPVEIHHYPNRPAARWLEEFTQWIKRVLSQEKGDTLIFLPGVFEINRLNQELTEHHTIPLHSSLNLHQQQLIFADSNQRKVILATNIAETSLTIPGIKIVIDSGWTKKSHYNIVKKGTEIITQKVSQASAMQRQGRAGRTARGKCFKFWPQSEEKFLSPQEAPEIFRCNLMPMVLELAHWGDPLGDQSSWIDKAPSLSKALKISQKDGFILPDNTLSQLGRNTLKMGIEPHLAKMLHWAESNQLQNTANILCAFSKETTKSKSVELLGALKQWRKGLTIDEVSIAKLVYLANPELLCMQKKSQYTSAAGHQIQFNNNPWPTEKFIAVWSCKSLNWAEYAIPISQETLLELSPLTKQVQGRWDEHKFVFIEQSYIASLCIGEKPVSCPNTKELKQILKKELEQNPFLFWPNHPFLKKLTFAYKNQKFSDISFWQENLDQWFFPFWSNQSSAKELESMPLEHMIWSLLGFDEQQKFTKNFPSELKLPSGRTAKIEYHNKAVVKGKLQEFFGCEGFALNFPIEAHLLAPNGKPLAQVVDFTHFWQSVYSEIRKENRGRYSKHPWPENPTIADATALTNAAIRRSK
jgi:ATP-dependent helicase HrpB